PDVSKVVVAATFTAEPLAETLEFILHQAGLALQLQFAPYHQVFHELISPTTALALNKRGVDVLLVRVEDLVRDITHIDAWRTLLRETVEHLSDALAQHARRVTVPTIFAVLSPSPNAPKEIMTELQSASSGLINHARALPGVLVLSAEDIDLAVVGESYDP